MRASREQTRHLPAIVVDRLTAAEDRVRAAALQYVGNRSRGAEAIAVRIILDMNSFIDAHCQRLADRFLHRFRSETDCGNFAAARFF
jgi:hypothetical protein